ncbi:hypothetical protein ACFO0N_09735 [Halobium salinum]|uniref:Uncharacterized protein n=1 Tax=Halobium salinum TaxID=1364940 RepID=A0ABD5PC43_9EURY|nr:hypothetical protein [Halobium salinum]
MATETESTAGISAHMRGVTVTTLASLAGVTAGVLSAFLAGTDPAAATNQLALLVLGALILVQFPLLRVGGIEVEDFGAKDYLYVVFMTFALWFVSWAILLTTGASL